MPGVNLPFQDGLYQLLHDLDQRISGVERQQNWGLTDSNGILRARAGNQPDGTNGIWFFNTDGSVATKLGDLGGGEYGLAVLPAGAAPGTPLQRVGGAICAQQLSQVSYSSTTWGDTSPAGPQVTVPIGPSGQAMVTIGCMISSGANAGGETALAGLSIDGAAPASSYPPLEEGISLNGSVVGSTLGAFLVSALAPGSHTFKMQYWVSTASVNGYFENSTLLVQPL